MAEILFASTLIVSDTNTRSRVAASVINYCWMVLQGLPGLPELNDVNKKYALALVNSPGRGAEAYVWALGTNTAVATKAYDDYVAAGGGGVNIPNLLRQSIDDAVINSLVGQIWTTLAEAPLGT